MYIREIEIENYGPIETLKINPEFREDGSPKPLIIIGRNGGGKTIVLAHVVNALINTKQLIFDDTEIKSGMAYKIRSPFYIRTGKFYSYAKVSFDQEMFVSDWQLSRLKSECDKNNENPQIKRDWDDIPLNRNNHISTNFGRDSQPAIDLIKKSTVLHFPSNRFEEPAWLNSDNLNVEVEYTNLKKVERRSDRKIISMNPMRANQRWLLDLILDRNIYELRTHSDDKSQHSVFLGYEGPADLIIKNAQILLSTMFQESQALRFGIGSRRSRMISIMREEKKWIPNLFQLSTGESLLLNLFLTIIRDFDLTGTPFANLADIKGVVVIDEIDAHLHATMQRDVLPKLIQLFPQVQFIVTSHSPLFLLGMEQTFGKDGSTILEMPTGERIHAEEFSEFGETYRTIEGTKRFRRDLEVALRASQKPVVFVEGDYDIRYLRKTAALFQRTDLLERFDFKNGEGYGNLDKIWSALSCRVSHALTPRVLLLYDCDTKKHAGSNGKATKRIISIVATNPIQSGIENLFTNQTIEKLEAANPAFIDLNPSHTKRIRGISTVVGAQRTVNKDEKNNICNWLCVNGIIDDFIGLNNVLDLIHEWLAAGEASHQEN